MLHPSTKKLIDRLAVMTAQKKIDWIEKDNGDVLYATEGYVVRLTPEPPRILLSTEGGKPLEDASSNVLSATAREDGGSYGDLVTTLARDACRDARGTEDAINTLLAGLSEAPVETDEADETQSETMEASVEADAETETADVYEEVSPEAVEEAGEDLVEDPVDETTALSAAAPDPSEAEIASSWSAGANDDTEAAPAVGVTDDDDLVDASVPEAAIVEEAATDEEVTAVSIDADADSETEVSGAVARLADEVNATPVDPIAASETETTHTADAPDEPETGLSADDAAATEEAEAIEETEDDTAYQAEDDTLEDEASREDAVSFAPTPSFSVQPDDAPEIGDEAEEMAPEAAAPAPEDDEALRADAPVTDEEVTAEAVAETEADDVETSVEETPVAPVWDAAPEADTSDSVQSDPVPAEPEPESEPETPVAAAPASNVHYIPFGAGGIEAEGADVSEAEVEEQLQDDETESAIAGAATMMNAPDEAPQTMETETAADPEPTPETPDETQTAATAEPVSAPDELADEPESGPPGAISLSGMGAGLGFGRTATGFQPTPPRPSAPSQPSESVTRGPVFIDATDDFTGDTEAAAESANVPDVGQLSDTEDYVEASVSDADLDAVSPQEQATSQPADADTSLSLVDSETSSEPAPQEEEAARPARPKTRFNPWT